jgi:hypothetical protein
MPQRLLQMSADRCLHTGPIGADHVEHELLSQYRLGNMFLFRYDLQQDAARDVGVIFLVDDHEVEVLDHESSDIRQRDISTFHGVVETAIRIFLNHSRITHVDPRLCSVYRFDAMPEDSGSCQLPMTIRWLPGEG